MYDWSSYLSKLPTTLEAPRPVRAAKPVTPKVTGKNYFGSPMDEYGALQDSEVRRVQSEFEPLREELQLGFHQRGISRSGFAIEDLAGLEGREAGALGQVQVGNTEKLIALKQQQEYQRFLEAQQKAQKGDSTSKWLGAALGIVGVAGAPFTGGATLPLAATGASMYLANA